MFAMNAGFKYWVIPFKAKAFLTIHVQVKRVPDYIKCLVENFRSLYSLAPPCAYIIRARAYPLGKSSGTFFSRVGGSQQPLTFSQSVGECLQTSNLIKSEIQLEPHYLS